MSDFLLSAVKFAVLSSFWVMNFYKCHLIPKPEVQNTKCWIANLFEIRS